MEVVSATSGCLTLVIPGSRVNQSHRCVDMSVKIQFTCISMMSVPIKREPPPQRVPAHHSRLRQSSTLLLKVLGTRSRPGHQLLQVGWRFASEDLGGREKDFKACSGFNVQPMKRSRHRSRLSFGSAGGSDTASCSCPAWKEQTLELYSIIVVKGGWKTSQKHPFNLYQH